MEYRTLGRSGVEVSPICLGTMLFGSRTDAAEADKIVGMARDAGINFVDTADSYNAGNSEKILGQLIKADRHRWVLATKVGNPVGDGPNESRLGRGRIIHSLEQSLRRLGTDFVDIYYLHRDDQETPLEESLSAISDVMRQGKIRYFAVSNIRGWRIAEIIRICDELGLYRPICAQPYYNAMNRMPETEFLPACDYYGLGVVAYSPLARGVLTGKYSTRSKPPLGSRIANKDARIMTTEFREESLVMARKIKERAEALGMTAGQFALNWVINNKYVTSAIAGPRTSEQWRENLEALNHALTLEDEAFIDGLVAPGHPSTPGYTDPKYPVKGRTPRMGVTCTS